MLLTILGTVIAVLVIGVVAFTYHVSRPAFDEALDTSEIPTIADRDIALTFARSGNHLYLVTDHDSDAITAIDLTEGYGIEATEDLISFYDKIGYDALSILEGDTVRLPLDTLGKPLDYHFPSVAVGTNYTEHAEEVYVDDPPFLFPKLAHPSTWNAPVDFVKRLDFEAELCMVPLSDITTDNRTANFGLLLCNDFTDRLTLIKQIKLKEPLGTTGFADGKGRETFLPTGYLFVIPRKPDFYEQIVIELAVNGQLKQRFTAGEMILKIDQIIDQAFALGSTMFHRHADSVKLLPEGNIPRGTMILTGTAAGVLFKPANIWHQGFYLKKNDQVHTRGEYLGTLDNRIR